MNENELKLLWHSSYQKIEDSLAICRKNTEDVTRLKVQHFLFSMKPIKVFTLLIGTVWVIGLSSLLFNLIINHIDEASPFFLVSATVQVILTIITIGVYVYQLNLINQIDFSKPVLIIQEYFLKLKISTLNVTRLLFLQLPVWTTFYWNEKMFLVENWLLWIIQGIVTMAFTYVALWLFFNIKYKNRNKKWFQWIFQGKEWQPIVQSMELLNQIEQYQGPENTIH